MTWMRLSSLVIDLIESVAFHLNNTIIRLFHDILLNGMDMFRPLGVEIALSHILVEKRSYLLLKRFP